MNSHVDPRRARQQNVVAVVVLAALLITAALIVLSFAVGGRADHSGRAPVAGEISSSAPRTAPEPTGSAVARGGGRQWPTASPGPTSSLELGDGSFPFAPTVPRTDPDEVAEAFALTATSWDALLDDNEADAAQRAADAFGAEELELPPAPERRSPGWTEAAQHWAYSSPVATIEDVEFDADPGVLTFAGTGEEIMPYAVSVEHGWLGRDEWVAPDAGSRVVLLSLVERDGQWSVIEYGYRLPPAG